MQNKEERFSLLLAYLILISEATSETRRCMSTDLCSIEVTMVAAVTCLLGACSSLNVKWFEEKEI